MGQFSFGILAACYVVFEIDAGHFFAFSSYINGVHNFLEI